MKFMILGIASVMALGACGPTPQASPIKDHPLSKEQQGAQLADQEQSRALAKQVETGDLTLDQAACEYHGGDWNYDRDLCERHLLRHPSEKDESQDSILAGRIGELAQLTTDPVAAARTSNDSSGEFLRDHPENYLGALKAGVRALHKEKLLAAASPAQERALDEIIY